MAFRLPRNQQFDYKPRFWEQEKEELEQRVKQMEGDDNATPEEIKERISMRFKNRKAYSSEAVGFRQAQIKKSNYTLVASVFALSIFCYILLEGSFADIIRYLF